MLDFNTLFSSKLDDLITQVDDRSIIIFKGFDVEQIRVLIAHQNSINNDLSIIDNDSLNLHKLQDQCLNMVTKIATSNEILVGFYEELLLLKEFLRFFVNRKIVVVENSLLEHWTPCVIDNTQALALFDYHKQDKNTDDEKILLLSELYSDVKVLDKDKILLLPIIIEYENVEYTDYWTNITEIYDEPDTEVTIELYTKEDWSYRLDLIHGIQKSALILVKNLDIDNFTSPLTYVLTELHIPFIVDEAELYDEKIIYDDNLFLPVLKKFWGKDAAFRTLKFYKNPDYSTDIEEISQGQLIAEIVDQCELAQNEGDYKNIFITAPTGAGKSILFQLPALYMSEKYGYVTVVVSPLIALMNDQVYQLNNERGITSAACINSSMTLEQRIATSEKIRSGKISTIYLAPELLLTINLQSFLGDRKVGLFVIDEAHTVTSWGRDFRSDYWFLGDFIKKCRREGMIFPVLCLTATAVYSGNDDVVGETINELNLERTIIHLGCVKRENIDFDIIVHNEDISEKLDVLKRNITLERLSEFVKKQEKTLVYCPYRTHVDDIYQMLSASSHSLIRRYHGKLPNAERKMTEIDFRCGKALGLICTKAFGMGVDVSDIVHIYHYAPTGSLADYVQEIGRAARDPALTGIAHTDYFRKDIRYIRTLNSISEMRHYQLREMLKKLYAIYCSKKRRNLLIGAETFEYLFGTDNVENRMKLGLQLIAKDLNNKFSFPVMIVRPKAMLAQNYVCIPKAIESEFLKKYGAYAKKQGGNGYRTVLLNSNKNNIMQVYSIGDTYLVDMEAIWENCYPDISFGMFKKTFFNTGYCVDGETYHFSPRVRVDIHYENEKYDSVVSLTEKWVTAIRDIFYKYRHSESKSFTARMFQDDLAEEFGDKAISHEKIVMLLDIFSCDVDENAAYTQVRSQVRVLTRRKQQNLDETVYFVNNTAYDRLPNFLSNYLHQCAPNTDENNFTRYYPSTQDKPIEIMPLLRLLEVLNFASYEIRGGEKAQVFVRINDPQKIQRLADAYYTNSVLQAVHDRHVKSQKIIEAFFTKQFTTEQRWDIIEQYFLGREDYVNEVLGI